MIRVLMGLSGDRPEMELWFNRAMKLDTNNYAACGNKLYFLDPRWHGSREEVLAFGKECLASKQWGGTVPLILVDAHRAVQAYFYNKEPERSEYWLRPEVWPDIKASYERFFALNPTDTARHQNYALYAYRCQQWGELNRQLSLLRSTNFTFFGGQQAFDKMVKEAAAHAPAKK